MPESEEDYIEFDKVYGDRKEALRNQVIDIFRSKFNFVNLKLYFKSLFRYHENICIVSRFTFDVITYLKVPAPKAAFIFLMNNEGEEVDKIVKCMKKNRKEDLSLYDTYTVASALRKYISDELNGLFLQSVILNLKNNFTSSNFEKEVEFLPFTMRDDRRKLFRELIKLFKAIHKNRNNNFMSLNDLFFVFLPSLLPKQAVNKKSRKFFQFLRKLRVLLKVNFEFVKIDFKEESDDDFYYECSLL